MTSKSNIINMHEFKRKQNSRFAQKSQPEKDLLQGRLDDLNISYRKCEGMLIQTKELLSKKPSWIERMLIPDIVRDNFIKGVEHYCNIRIAMKSIEREAKDIHFKLNSLT